MFKKYFSYTVTVLLLVICFGCAKKEETPLEPDTGGGGGGTQQNTVAIRNFAFDPQSLTVSAGTMITWTNNDSANHTVTSTSSVFDSGTMTQNQTFSFTFTTAGTYSYKCNFHPSMTATIIVQ